MVHETRGLLWRVSVIQWIALGAAAAWLLFAIGGLIYESLKRAKAEGNWMLKYLLIFQGMCVLGIIAVLMGAIV